MSSFKEGDESEFIKTFFQLNVASDVYKTNNVLYRLLFLHFCIILVINESQAHDMISCNKYQVL